MRTEYYENGVLVRVEDDGIAYEPQEPSHFTQIGVRECFHALFEAMVRENVITLEKAQAVRDRMLAALKR